MSLLQVLVVLAVIAGVGVVAAGVIRVGLDDAPPSTPSSPLPSTDLLPRDIDEVRFSLAFRGYRMDEVDEVLTRFATELADRRAEVAERDLRLAEQDAQLAEQDAQLQRLRQQGGSTTAQGSPAPGATG
ncbi:MAG: DivIVA domain-containing protein [Angustibacter sp.]